METDPSYQENKSPNASPLSIASSPPVGGGVSDFVTPTTYFRQPGNDSFHDKPPSHSYSMDSAPPLLMKILSMVPFRIMTPTHLFLRILIRPIPVPSLPALGSGRLIYTT
jgi:hypothetical protein